MKHGLGLAFGLVTGAIAVLGTIRTLLEVGGGQSFSLQLIAFYVGASAIAVGCAGGILVAALVILGGVLFDYADTDAVGRGFLGLLGLAALAGGVYVWRRYGKAPAVT